MLSKITLSTLILFCSCSFITAQEKGKIRGGLEAVMPIPIVSDIGTLLGAIELKYNIRANMNIGLRTEYADYSLSKLIASNKIVFFFSYLRSFNLDFYLGGGKWIK